MDTTRRGFLSAASLSTAGLVAAATSISSLMADTAVAATPSLTASKVEKPKEELEDFVYDIENGSEGY